MTCLLIVIHWTHRIKLCLHVNLPFLQTWLLFAVGSYTYNTEKSKENVMVSPHKMILSVRLYSYILLSLPGTMFRFKIHMFPRFKLQEQEDDA